MTEQITQYRIPAHVDRVFSHAPLIRSWKDAEGQRHDEYGPTRWFVHFSGSTESLCFGAEKPELAEGDAVDIIIRRRKA